MRGHKVVIMTDLIITIPDLLNRIDFVRFGWLGICARAGTPQPIVALLNRHITSIVASPDYRAVAERAGSVPVSSTPAELRQVIDQTLADVLATVQEFGLQQDP